MWHNGAVITATINQKPSTMWPIESPTYHDDTATWHAQFFDEKLYRGCRIH